MKLIRSCKRYKDIIEGTASKYSYIHRTAEDLFSSYGYSFIKTPIFEETDLFKRGIGEATDVVEKEMYTFIDKGERSITLRPEGTASVVRAYLENKIYAKEEVSKFYYLDQCLNMKDHKLEDKENSTKLELKFLESSPILDAEVIAMGYHLEKLGITDLEVNINSVWRTRF